MKNIARERKVTQAYVQSRRDKGIEPTANQIWTYIRSAWPDLKEEEQEAIFQACDNRRKTK